MGYSLDKTINGVKFELQHGGDSYEAWIPMLNGQECICVKRDRSYDGTRACVWKWECSFWPEAGKSTEQDRFVAKIYESHGECFSRELDDLKLRDMAMREALKARDEFWRELREVAKLNPK